MAYEKTVWVNGQAPALDADHLNKMEQGIADAVSVTPQSLTDDQKSQARGNINAAPGGYGYGENKYFKSWNDNDGSQFESYLDNLLDGSDKIIRLTTLTDYPSNVLSGNGGFADVALASNGVIFVEWCGPTDVAAGTTVGMQKAYKKKLLDGTWLPWEYENPLLNLGVEYRSTERYLGKPVYVQAVNFGALPNATTKTVTWATADEVSAVLSVEATGSQGAPVGLGASLSGTEITATTTTLYIKSSGDYSSNTAVFRIKYTKTTD